MSEWRIGIVPVVILIGWISAEVLSRLGGRRAQQSADPSLGLWLLRPWGAWAVLSIVFRLNWDSGFNNRRTFPFFANLWDEKASLTQWLEVLAGSPFLWAWGSVALITIFLLSLMVYIALSERKRSSPEVWMTRVFVCCAGFVVLALSIGSTPQGGISESPTHRSSLIGAWQPHSSMLYTLPLMNSTTEYMERFVKYQRGKFLSRTIHAQSHPPLASLSLGLIASSAGHTTHTWESIRLPAMRQDLTIAMAAVGAWIVLLVYLLGRTMFGSVKVGLLAAALWMTMPTSLAYTTFSQDIVYTVFFVAALGLIWRIGTTEERPWWAMSVCGVCFMCLVFLSYSWCIVTSILVVFLFLMKKRQGWSWVEFGLRTCFPLALMTVLSGYIMIRFRLDYLEMYHLSSQFVETWYTVLSDNYRGAMAWVGGQMDLFLLMGAVPAVAAFVAIRSGLCKRPLSPQILFASVVLGLYLLPILFGPLPLRMEVARCWMWVLAIPVVFAAKWMMDHTSPRFCSWAVASSALTYLVIRQFMTVAP